MHAYADDISLYSTSKPWLTASLPIIATTLQENYPLKVNQNKTEWVDFGCTDGTWKSVRQLGSLIDTEADITRRIALASSAYGQLYTLWLRRGKVDEAR